MIHIIHLENTMEVKKKEVYIVPFVSYIEPTLSRVSQCDEIEIISRYKLTGIKYACIMNQLETQKSQSGF